MVKKGTERIKGELEIDHERGVVYFHASKQKVAERFNAVTLLRICRLPSPIPQDKILDLTYGHDLGATDVKNS